MGCTCVVGLQWGDEAKGKIVDLLTDQHDYIVRFNGGANAGHTVVQNGKTFKFSLLPTGVLRPHLRSVIGNGVVVYPPRFLEEVENLRAAGIAVGDNLVLSDHDKVGRVCGIRVVELLYPDHLRDRLRVIVPRKNRLLRALSAEARA